MVFIEFILIMYLIIGIILGGVVLSDKVALTPFDSSKVGIYDVKLGSFKTNKTVLSGCIGLFRVS